MFHGHPFIYTLRGIRDIYACLNHKRKLMEFLIFSFHEIYGLFELKKKVKGKKVKERKSVEIVMFFWLFVMVKVKGKKIKNNDIK